MEKLGDLLFYNLPFEKGSRILTLKTLKKHYPFLDDEELYWNTMASEFNGEILKYTIRTEVRGTCTLYMKVEEDALLIACSHGTTANVLSKYAADVLSNWCSEGKYDFSKYYWPGVYGESCSKYMIFEYEYGRAKLRLRPAYVGLYRPNSILPELTEENNFIDRSNDIILDPVKLTSKDTKVLGFCIAETKTSRFLINHYIILIPFLAEATKDKASIRYYDRFVLDWSELLDYEYSSYEEELLKLSFLIREHTVSSEFSRLQDDPDKFRMILAYWHRALPLFSGRAYKNYIYAYGKYCMRGKPKKRRMLLYQMKFEIPKLVFIWKDRGQYFSLKIRVRIANKLYPLSEQRSSDFFVTVKGATRQFFLLSSLDESRLVQFFTESRGQMIILKSHYEGEIVDFISKLKAQYEFR